MNNEKPTEEESSSTFLEGGKFVISSRFSSITPLKQQGGRFYRLFKAMRFGKWCVLKCLRPEYACNPEFISLLQKEFEIGFRFSHPNIVQTINFEEVADLGACIVMEYIDGRTLNEWFLEHKRNKKEIVDILRSIGNAIDYIHQLQVVHRDVKPTNVMITNNGNHVKIIDFGLADADNYAILKQPGGTLRYVAPEQLDGKVTMDGRADIYSFGIIVSDANKILSPRSSRLAHIAAKCCEQDREKRYSTLSEIKWENHTNKRILIGFSILLLTFILISFGAFLHMNSSPTPKKIDNAVSNARKVQIPVPITEKKVAKDSNTIHRKEVAYPKTSNEDKLQNTIGGKPMGTQIRAMTKENWEDYLKRLNSGDSHTARCDLPLAISINTDNKERQDRLDKKIKSLIKGIAKSRQEDEETLYGIALSIMHDEQAKFILDPVNSKRIEAAYEKAKQLRKANQQEHS